MTAWRESPNEGELFTTIVVAVPLLLFGEEMCLTLVSWIRFVTTAKMVFLFFMELSAS